MLVYHNSHLAKRLFPKVVKADKHNFVANATVHVSEEHITALTVLQKTLADFTSSVIHKIPKLISTLKFPSNCKLRNVANCWLPSMKTHWDWHDYNIRWRPHTKLWELHSCAASSYKFNCQLEYELSAVFPGIWSLSIWAFQSFADFAFLQSDFFSSVCSRIILKGESVLY